LPWEKWWLTISTCEVWCYVLVLISVLIMQTGKIVLDHADERALGLHLLQFAEVRQVFIEPICPLPFLTCLLALYWLSCKFWVYQFIYNVLCRLLRRPVLTYCQMCCVNTSIIYLKTTQDFIPIARYDWMIEQWLVFIPVLELRLSTLLTCTCLLFNWMDDTGWVSDLNACTSIPYPMFCLHFSHKNTSNIAY